MVNNPIGYYGQDNSKPGDDDNLDKLARDALGLVPSSIDLSSFKFLVIVHAGQDQADDQYNVLSDEIWSSCYCSVFPHYKSYGALLSHGQSFGNYVFLSEQDSLGTFAHEWGHLFGLPDLYDVTGQTANSYVGYWSIMDHHRDSPSYIGAWGDTVLGWLSPAITDTTAVLSALDLKPLESAQATAVLIPVSQSQYYFIELRTKSGRDSQLPNSGILVYFVDERVESGRGILRLVNPKSGMIFSPARASSFDSAVFISSDELRDSDNQVYIAFLEESGFMTVLFANHEFSGFSIRTSLRASLAPTSVAYGDQVTVTGTLLKDDGLPLAGEAVEVQILDQSSGQWRKIDSATTDPLGQVSFTLRLEYDVGIRTLRLFYPGGKTGTVWHASSHVEVGVQIRPAKMTMTIAAPSLAVSAFPIEISITGVGGAPLTGVSVTVYVNNFQQVVTTDSNGKVTLVLPVPVQPGSLEVTAKADAPNYQTALATSNVMVFPLWLIALLAALLVIGAVSLGLQRRAVKGKVPKGASELPSLSTAAMKQFCFDCGTELPPDSKFCNECGSAQTDRSQ
jgi:M6 family metalloprotease-like protein